MITLDDIHKQRLEIEQLEEELYEARETLELIESQYLESIADCTNTNCFFNNPNYTKQCVLTIHAATCLQYKPKTQ